MSAEDLSNFVAITGASQDQAQFFLESSGGDLNAAVSAFFESAGAGGSTAATTGDDDDDFDIPDEDDDNEDGVPPAAAAPPAAAPTPAAASSSWGGGRTLSGAPAAGGRSGGFGTQSGSSSGSSTPSRNPMRSNHNARVATLRDLSSSAPPPPPHGHGDSDDDDDDDADKDPSTFFTGGEKSGLSVENPNSRRKTGGASDVVKGILQKAKEGGARMAGAATGPSGSAQSRSVFSGSAHTLGSDETPSTYIPSPSASSSNPRGARSNLPGSFPGAGGGSADENDEPLGTDEQPTVRNLTFWEDGFSIDDGELLKYDEHQELLAALNTGRAPISLLKVRHDEPVELRIAKRLHEKWTPQPAAPKGPWSGTGNRLGSEAGPVAAAASASASAAKVPASAPAPTSTTFEVDQSAPTTNLQIRLRDGTRMVARFNHTHTVGDVRAYINASNPGQASVPYALQTTFPSRDLEDNAATLKDANLLGSVVIQRGL